MVAGAALLCSNYFAPAAPPGEGEGAAAPPNRLCRGLSVAAGVEAPPAAVVAAAGPPAGAVEAEGLLPLLRLLLQLLPPTQLRRTWLGLSRALVAPPVACAVWGWCVFVVSVQALRGRTVHLSTIREA